MDVVDWRCLKTLTLEAEDTHTQPLVERRRLPRLSFARPLQYRNVFKPYEVYAGSLARDIGARGVRVATPVPLVKKDRLVLLFSLSDSLRMIRAISQVVWNRRKPFGSQYESGLQFIEITSEDQGEIAGFVEQGVVPGA